MDRALILQHLEQAERRVIEGAEHVDKQRDVVARLGWGGHSTAAAEAVLHEFERAQVVHLAERERLRAQLAVMNALEAASRRGPAGRAAATADPRT